LAFAKLLNTVQMLKYVTIIFKVKYPTLKACFISNLLDQILAC